MRALRQRTGGQVRFAGVGGRAMAAEGRHEPLFDRRSYDHRVQCRSRGALRSSCGACARRRAPFVAARPDVLVIIDSPDFTLGIARRVRAADPAIPIVDYVSPSVWAWRPGRARAMRGYVDHVLALLPFEPEVHSGSAGRLAPMSAIRWPSAWRAAPERGGGAAAARDAAGAAGAARKPARRDPPAAGIFAETVALVTRESGRSRSSCRRSRIWSTIRGATAHWPVRPRIVVEAADKEAAFRVARAALAKSGTVTLELALAGVPMVAAYKVSPLEAWVGRGIRCDCRR